MRLDAPLVGERLCIRNYEPADLDFSSGMWFDPENGKYLSDPTAEYVDATYQKALDSLQDSRSGYYLTVWDGRERVGTCCVFPDKNREEYDIGYCVHRSRWGQGLGTELVGLLVDWVRAQGGKAVTAEAAKENRASRALLEKLGFEAVRESSFRKYHMDLRFESYIYRLDLT